MSFLFGGYSVFGHESRVQLREEDIAMLGMMGVLLSDRRKQAPKVQEILTKYGELILCRNGVHDPDKSRGLITLTMEAAESEITELAGELMDVPGVDVSVAHFPIDSKW